MTRVKEQQEQLEEMLAVCSDLGAEVEYHPEYGHFTAMVWEGWALPHDEGKALSIQDQIYQRTAQYPRLVCYRFDPFSTLVYAV